jgi:dipeptidyl aminopeptidase/acylaminoacyl peptidase
MSSSQIAPYGAWKSPITSDLIVGGSVTLGQLALDGDDIYWSELRPSEGGRNVLMRRSPGGQVEQVTPQGFNVRTTTHEYGGGAYLVDNGTVYFSNFADQRMYRQERGGQPQPITPEGDIRYADSAIDRRHNRLICVREDHREAGEAVNTLIALALDGSAQQQALVAGADFYSTPRISPDGARLAWLSWNHPNMPWDGTELWVAPIEADGSLGTAERVAGGRDESIFQPDWSPDGILHFVSDRSGWWNLYRWRDGQAEALCPMEAEFGVPQWVFAMTTYGFESANRIVCVYEADGVDHLAILDSTSGALDPIELPYTRYASPQVGAGRVLFVGGSPTSFSAVVLLDLDTRRHQELRKSSELTIDPGYISVPQAITFPTENGQTAHAFFYAPHNHDYSAPPGERAPLLVMSHGGPTSSASPVLHLQKQYWTSRGIAVLDVTDGGSTGYGREYRRRLNGQWGVVDMNDCANGARYLAQRREVDRNRLAITGGSAGGYTTLCALTFRDEFRAGASHFGISDLEVFVHDTHKFESRYLDGLVGPYPERKDLYYERSPIHFTNRLECPVIMFQGLEDKIVPPNQAELMLDALRAKHLPVAYVPFEGEQHGFRKAENIKRALDGEFYFYQKYLIGLPVELPEWIQDFPPE